MVRPRIHIPNIVGRNSAGILNASPKVDSQGLVAENLVAANHIARGIRIKNENAVGASIKGNPVVVFIILDQS